MVDLVTAGLILVLAGFGVIAISILSESRKGGGQVKGGGVIMVGPIPIILGSDAKWASVAVVLAIVLVILSVVVYMV